jgi:8-oxo-dGTP pyrophosphatase MutT (NUDIX family)
VSIAVPAAQVVVQGFDPGFGPGRDDLAEKSRELTIALLVMTPEPLSRRQFIPGHITCTALVRHPSRDAVLVMHHHRLKRWLLPGGHVDKSDTTLAETAAREAFEETHVRIDFSVAPVLAGIDVHAIPPKHNDPMHLHHDLIWSFRALSEEIAETDEAPLVAWAEKSDWDRLALAESIRRSIARV